MKKGISCDGNRCTSDFGNFQVEYIYKWVRAEKYTVTSQRSSHSSLFIAPFRQRRGFLPQNSFYPPLVASFRPRGHYPGQSPAHISVAVRKKSLYCFADCRISGLRESELDRGTHLQLISFKSLRDCELVKLIGNRVVGVRKTLTGVFPFGLRL
jgi:hypothetical protein